MRKFTLSQLVILVGLFVVTSGISFAQVSVKSPIDEKNVRAEMGFLASDAMQGRGSGTGYERIAAEYIGSLFMEFGLDPAGQNGFDGKPTYVQTVSFGRNTFAENPWLKFGNTQLEHGKEMIVLRANTGQI